MSDPEPIPHDARSHFALGYLQRAVEFALKEPSEENIAFLAVAAKIANEVAEGEGPCDIAPIIANAFLHDVGYARGEHNFHRNPEIRSPGAGMVSWQEHRRLSIRRELVRIQGELATWDAFTEAATAVSAAVSKLDEQRR